METVSYQNDSKSVLVRAKHATPASGPPPGTAAEGGVDGGQYQTLPPTEKEDQLAAALV